jgi:hypothetical protein
MADAPHLGCGVQRTWGFKSPLAHHEQFHETATNEATDSKGFVISSPCADGITVPHPVFVMTHHERPSFTLSDTTFHYVDGDPATCSSESDPRAWTELPSRSSIDSD